MHNIEEIKKKLVVSGNLVRTNVLLGKIIEYKSVRDSGHDDTTLDLLLRIYLAENQQVRAKEICEQLMLSPSHISRTLDEVEDAGLITRRKDDNDGRAQAIRLSNKGLSVVEDFIPKLIDALDATIYASLNKKDIASFNAILKKMNTHMEDTIEELIC